jgi:hypothetical protein
VLSFRSLDPDLSEGTRTEKKEELRMVNHNFGDGEIGFFNLAEEDDDDNCFLWKNGAPDVFASMARWNSLTIVVSISKLAGR